MKPFVVDVFFMDANDKLRKKRIEANTLDYALYIMRQQSNKSGVTKIVVSKRSDYGGQISKIKVWNQPLF